MTPREVLIAARKLIERPEAWTQAALAADANGAYTGVKNPAAVCWCMIGATAHVSPADERGDIVDPAYFDALNALREAIDDDLGNFNDRSTHAEVLAAFDRAIEACP